MIIGRCIENDNDNRKKMIMPKEGRGVDGQQELFLLMTLCQVPRGGQALASWGLVRRTSQT